MPLTENISGVIKGAVGTESQFNGLREAGLFGVVTDRGHRFGYIPADGSPVTMLASSPDSVPYVEEIDGSELITIQQGATQRSIQISTLGEWTGTLVLGETSSTAYRGDRGKTAYDHSQITAGNPHGTTFAQLASKPTTLSGYGITDAQPLDSDLTAIAALSTQAFGRSLLTQADAASARTAIGAVKTPVVWRQNAIVGSGVSTETTWTTIAVNMDYPIDFWYYTGGGACTLRIYNEVKSASTLVYTASIPASDALYHMHIVFDNTNALAEIGDTRVILIRPDLVNFSGTFIITAQGSGGVGECLVPLNLTYTAA